MGHYRRVFALLALSCLAYTCQITSAYAAELPDPDAPAEEAPVVDLPPADQEDSGGEVVVEDEKNVYHIEADTIIIQPVAGSEDDSLDEPVVDVPVGNEDDPLPGAADSSEDSPPDDLQAEEELPPAPLAAGADGFPFYGSCWVKGSAPDLGDVTLFFPSNYKTGYIGLDASGRLYNVSNNSWSGVLYVNSSGTSYTVSFGSWGLPTYRRYSGSSYQNVTLYLTPQDGNIVFPDGPSPSYSISDLLPYLSVLLLGGVFLCCMRKS